MNKPFEIVDDKLRIPEPGARGRGRVSELTQALMDGKTVMVPRDSKSGHHSTTLKARGYRLRQHQRAEGLVLWAEKIGEETVG